jgi:hypothetical protein
MVVAADRRLREQAKPLWQEAKELNLIFSAIFRNTKPGEGFALLGIQSAFVLRHSSFCGRIQPVYPYNRV